MLLSAADREKHSSPAFCLPTWGEPSPGAIPADSGRGAGCSPAPGEATLKHTDPNHPLIPAGSPWSPGSQTQTRSGSRARAQRDAQRRGALPLLPLAKPRGSAAARQSRGTPSLCEAAALSALLWSWWTPRRARPRRRGKEVRGGRGARRSCSGNSGVVVGAPQGPQKPPQSLHRDQAKAVQEDCPPTPPEGFLDDLGAGCRCLLQEQPPKTRACPNRHRGDAQGQGALGTPSSAQTASPAWIRGIFPFSIQQDGASEPSTAQEVWFQATASSSETEREVCQHREVDLNAFWRATGHGTLPPSRNTLFWGQFTRISTQTLVTLRRGDCTTGLWRLRAAAGQLRPLLRLFVRGGSLHCIFLPLFLLYTHVRQSDSATLPTTNEITKRQETGI